MQSKLRIPTDRENIEITCPSCKTIQNLSSNTMNDDLSAIKDKATLEKILSRIRATKVNVLLIGATGSGKSSTISALFENYGNGRKSSAKVGQTSRPETMDVSAHEMDNLVIWDTPGLGDSTKQDEEHQQKPHRNEYRRLLGHIRRRKPRLDLREGKSRRHHRRFHYW